jgi:hypothetical protein
MTKEDEYFDFVYKTAEAVGKRFVLDSGEGREFIDPKTGWDVEDLSGWLIDPEDTKKLIEARNAMTAYDVFGEYYRFAVWSLSQTGDLIIEFKDYEN